MSGGETFDIVTPLDFALMGAAGHTLESRWLLLRDTLAGIADVDEDAADYVLLAYGFLPSMRELASVGACDAILDVCVQMIAYACERINSGATVH